MSPELEHGKDYSFLSLQGGTLLFWYIIDGRVLASLQSPYVGNNRPTIFDRNLVPISHHRVVTVSDGVKELAVGHLPVLILVIVRDAQKTVFRSDPITNPGGAVT